MKKRNVFLLIISLLLAILSYFSNNALAEKNNNIFLTISPPINELILEPGSKSSYGLTLYNNSDQPVIVDLRASPFYPQGEEGEVTIADEPLPKSRDWVTVYPQRLKILPHESKVVSYTINLPSTASPGGFYFAIVASSNNHKYQGVAENQIEGGSAIVSSLSELVLVRINGPVHYGAQILSFGTKNNRRFFNHGPVEFRIRVKNLSNVHSIFSNQIKVHNLILPEDYLINIKGQRILPNATRLFKGQLPNKWHFGYYRAELLTTYAGGNNLRRVIVFWIIPLKKLAIAASGFFVIILLVFILIRRSKEKAEEIKELERAVEELKEVKKNRE